MKEKSNSMSRIFRTVRSFKMQSMFIRLFLVVLLTSLLFSIVHMTTMIYVNRVMLEKETQAQTVYMDYVIDLIDGRISNIRNYINAIVVDKYFTKTLDQYSRVLRGYYQMTDISTNLNKLQTVKVGDESIRDLFVYMDGYQYTATSTGVMDGGLYLNRYFGDEAGRWAQYFEEKNRLRIVAADVYDENGNASGVLCVLNSLYLDAKKIGTLVVEVDPDAMIQPSAFSDFTSDRIIFLILYDSEKAKVEGSGGRRSPQKNTPLME